MQQAVVSCEQAIQAQPAFSSSVKATLEASCQQAASGDPSAFLEADQQLCIKLIDDTTTPGPAREQGLAGCKKVK